MLSNEEEKGQDPDQHQHENSTVNAVGNLNRRLGSVVVSSWPARVSVVTARPYRSLAHPCRPVVTRCRAALRFPAG